MAFGVGTSVKIYVGVGGTGWKGVAVAVESDGAQTIKGPVDWRGVDPPPTRAHAMINNPRQSKARKRAGFRQTGMTCRVG